ncbi:unnamed protein product [Amoebophrya sp. A25]|nr:unnamed protein product [Amoebophrya sp. A25]|eukprot:GSA25T00002398001.1
MMTLPRISCWAYMCVLLVLFPPCRGITRQQEKKAVVDWDGEPREVQPTALIESGSGAHAGIRRSATGPVLVKHTAARSSALPKQMQTGSRKAAAAVRSDPKPIASSQDPVLETASHQSKLRAAASQLKKEVDTSEKDLRALAQKLTKLKETELYLGQELNDAVQDHMEKEQRLNDDLLHALQTLKNAQITIGPGDIKLILHRGFSGDTSTTRHLRISRKSTISDVVDVVYSVFELDISRENVKQELGGLVLTSGSASGTTTTTPPLLQNPSITVSELLDGETKQLELTAELSASKEGDPRAYAFPSGKARITVGRQEMGNFAKDYRHKIASHLPGGLSTTTIDGLLTGASLIWNQFEEYVRGFLDGQGPVESELYWWDQLQLVISVEGYIDYPKPLLLRWVKRGPQRWQNLPGMNVGGSDPYIYPGSGRCGGYRFDFDQIAMQIRVEKALC